MMLMLLKINLNLYIYENITSGDDVVVFNTSDLGGQFITTGRPSVIYKCSHYFRVSKQ